MVSEDGDCQAEELKEWLSDQAPVASVGHTGRIECAQFGQLLGGCNSFLVIRPEHLFETMFGPSDQFQGFIMLIQLYQRLGQLHLASIGTITALFREFQRYPVLSGAVSG